jgi:hypothetical protein
MMFRRSLLVFVVAPLLAGPCAAYADKPKSTPRARVSAVVFAGWLERIVVKEQGKVVKAKLDTGAKTSSIHATHIEEFERDGEPWVRFDLGDDPDGDGKPVTVEKPVVRRTRIKDHHSPSTRRQTVELEVCMAGVRHRVQFTLADRSNFLYPILLGRRFLAGVAVVDPAKKYLTQPECSEGDGAR